MSRIAAGGIPRVLPRSHSGYVAVDETNVCHLLVPDLQRPRVLHRDRPDPPMTMPRTRDRVRDELSELDPGERALLELSLQRGISDEDLARALGADADEVGKRR